MKLIMESRLHKKIAIKIAKIKNTEYHGDKGVDIRTKTQAIEVEVNPDAFGHAKKQLAGSAATPYILVSNNLIKPALEVTKGTRFGVMNQSARIIKRGIKKP